MVVAARPGWTASSLDAYGYVVIPGAVRDDKVNEALRLFNLTIRRNGLTAPEIASSQGTTYFPHLRWHKEVMALLPPPEQLSPYVDVEPGDRWADPQILLRFPDEGKPCPLEPHRDEEPEWARDYRYKAIVGVALSTVRSSDGALVVWPQSHRGYYGVPQVVPMVAGDAVVMNPQLGHAGSLNLGSHVRYAVYFRLLTPTL